MYEAIIQTVNKEQKKKKKSEFNLGLSLRSLREKAGLSQKELAQRTEIDPRTITAIEKGRIRTPSLDKLQAIAEALELKVSDIFRQIETEMPENIYLGDQKGEFSMDFSKAGFRLISYTPRIKSMFCGKIILAGRKTIEKLKLDAKALIFLQVIIGKLQVNIEGREYLLKEGQNLLFDGNFEHSLANPLLKETSFLFFTSPSFLH